MSGQNRRDFLGASAKLLIGASALASTSVLASQHGGHGGVTVQATVWRLTPQPKIPVRPVSTGVECGSCPTQKTRWLRRVWVGATTLTAPITKS